MTVYVGPTNWWWKDSPDAAFNCKVKGTLRTGGLGATLTDGSTIMCASNGVAILVAPSCTQVSSQWAGGQYNSTQVGDKCCVSEWSGLQTALTNAGFTPTDWFVPSLSQLQLGYQCRANWDSFSANNYWSSTEFSATDAYGVGYTNGGAFYGSKTITRCVRAFRCVTY